MIPEKLELMLNDEQYNLLSKWCEASKTYYTDEAIMSDPEFDMLQETLLDYAIPELSDFINSGIYNNNKIEHVTVNTEMISLFKIKYKDRSTITDIKKFIVDGLRNKLTIYYGPKFDGAALKIFWNLDKKIITKIITRGGLDVTKHFKNHPDILDTIKYNKPFIAGELIIKKSVFIDNYSDEWENPRNFVGKLLKQNEISSQIKSDLNFIACTDGTNPLIENIFVWNELTQEKLYQIEDIAKFFKKEEYPFLCDGVVIGYMTETRVVKNNYPLNMVAVKIQGARAKTRVIGFEYSQKKSGKLTPIVLIEHVPLDGATMTKANGYNYQNLLDKRIGIGSEIEIEKSGDIIPVIVKVHTFSNQITLPTCEYSHIGKHLIALNLEESRKYKFVLSLKLLKLDGIGETLSNKIGTVVDFNIFNLFNTKFKPDICEILGGGSNWLKFSEIYNIKSFYLDEVIALIQFNGVGAVMSKRIAMLITKKSNDTSNMSGEVLAICKGEGFQRIKDVIEYLKIHGIRVLPPYEVNDTTLTYELSGNPPGKMTKEEFKLRVKAIYPNSIYESIKKTTKILFCDDLQSNTSKCNKARKYNIQMITYKDFLDGKVKI